MLRLAFVNMPFADWNRPSLALGQLSSLLRREFDARISVDLCYLNQDVAEYFGVAEYESISSSHDHVDTGLGDWLFRPIAFPGLPDNTQDYFARFYRGERWSGFREYVLERRAGLRDLCDRLIDRYGLADADVVGFTSMFTQHVASLALAQMIKERRPDTLTIIGGANCEAPMSAVIAEHAPAIDFVFSGPALETVPAFVGHVLDGDLAAVDAVPGILSRRNCREPRFRRALGRDHDINDLIPPDYDAFLRAIVEHDALRAAGTSEPMLYFETSRGCWWGERSHCTFCGLNGQSMGYRMMDTELALKQFNWLFGFAPEYPALFCTDNVMPRHYPREVFSRLTPPPGVSIFYEVKLPLSRKDMAWMAAGGVTVVQPGIEALATSTLKLMNKGTTAFQNLQFLKNCREFGIEPRWNLLIGFPGEDPAVYREYARTIPRLTHLPPPDGVFMVRFDRYSPYFNQRDDYGLDLHPMDYYRLIYPFDDEALSDLAYFFADHNLSPYMLNAVEWHGTLSGLVRNWQEAWRTGPARELRLMDSADGEPVIVDSRPDTPVVHPVDADTARLLSRLRAPVRRAQLAAEWPGGPDDLAERLDWLDERSTLFEEGDRLLSLVTADAGDETETETETEVEQAPSGRRTLPILTAAPKRKHP